MGYIKVSCSVVFASSETYSVGSFLSCPMWFSAKMLPPFALFWKLVWQIQGNLVYFINQVHSENWRNCWINQAIRFVQIVGHQTQNGCKFFRLNKKFFVLLFWFFFLHLALFAQWKMSSCSWDFFFCGCWLDITLTIFLLTELFGMHQVLKSRSIYLYQVFWCS